MQKCKKVFLFLSSFCSAKCVKFSPTNFFFLAHFCVFVFVVCESELLARLLRKLIEAKIVSLCYWCLDIFHFFRGLLHPILCKKEVGEKEKVRRKKPHLAFISTRLTFSVWPKKPLRIHRVWLSSICDTFTACVCVFRNEAICGRITYMHTHIQYRGFRKYRIRKQDFFRSYELFPILKLKFSIIKSRKWRISGNNWRNGHPQLSRYFRKPLYFYSTHFGMTKEINPSES